MSAGEIKLDDFGRFFAGEVPWHFYFEVILRTAVLYMLLIVAMRFMGKRMSSQLSRNEMAAITSLAAAIGVPLMNPDRGILPAFIIAALIIGFQYIISKYAAKNKKIESLTQDKYNKIVIEGVLNIKAMKITRLSQERVFAQLRSQGIIQLGMVKGLYFEAGGSFSLFRFSEQIPGLSILPEWDNDWQNPLLSQSGEEVCHYCGKHRTVETGYGCCKNCGKSTWAKSVIKNNN